MSLNNKIKGAVLYGSLLAFMAFVIYVLYINQDIFYAAHERSEFLYGSPFFHRLMSKPFGLMQYVGAWLTQFFYYPALGSCILVMIWALIFIVGIKAFRLKGEASALMLLPVACLLTSVVDLGYWIYISTIRGYWFSQSVGYFCFVMLLWAARCTPRKWHIVWYLLGACLYPVLGWFSLLFVICLALVGKSTWRELIALAMLIFIPVVWRYLLYSNLKYNDIMFAGFPRFVTASDCSEYLTIPFWVLAALSIIIPICSKYLVKWFVPVVCVIVGVVCTKSFMYQDKNYIDEMRMVRNAEADNWKEVLSIAESNPTPTVSILMLKNLALMYEGELLDRAFKTSNDGVNITSKDSVHVSFLEIAAPIVYYHYGMTNEAIRLNSECAVQTGFCPFYLKQLSRCAYANGDAKLVERYNKLIQHAPFYEDWHPAPTSAKTLELQTAFMDAITGVENSDSYIVNNVSMWNQSESKVASEQAVFFSMLRRDSRRFWASLRNYVKLHMQEEFPLHAQEAYIMYMDKAPEQKRMIIPVEQGIYDRYKIFWSSLEGYVKSGLSKEETANRMRNEFGDTYWYYNVFAKRVY